MILCAKMFAGFTDVSRDFCGFGFCVLVDCVLYVVLLVFNFRFSLLMDYGY